FSSRRRHTRFSRDWSSDVCSSDLDLEKDAAEAIERLEAEKTALAEAEEAAGPRALALQGEVNEKAAALKELQAAFDLKTESVAKIGRASCRERVENTGIGVC